MDSLIELFCLVDDFCKEFMLEWNRQLLTNGMKKRTRSSKLQMSEIITIIIFFHQSQFRNFKTYYLNYICTYLKGYFPPLVSYNRFVELMSSALMPLCFFVICQQTTPTGIYFVDSTKIRVCENKRINQNRVFKGIAKRAKSSMGWFYGFKW